jgi:hypothetical protein
MELTGNETNHKNEELFILHPGITTHWNNISITVTQFSLPPEPELVGKFLSNGKLVTITDKIQTDIYCTSQKYAENFDCYMSPYICEECSTDDKKEIVICKCKDLELENYFKNSQKILPISDGIMNLNYQDDFIYANFGELPVDIVLKVDGYRLAGINDFNICTMKTHELIGCYNCRNGAELNFTCTTDEGIALAEIVCDLNVAFVVKCTKEGNNELLRLTFDRAHIHLICTVHCLSGNTNIEIKGTLFLIPEEEIIENKHWSGSGTNNRNEENNHYYNLLPFNLPHINLPDLFGFVSTIHNFLTLIGILTLCLLLFCLCVRFNFAFQIYKLISHKILFVFLVLICLPPASAEGDDSCDSCTQQKLSKMTFKIFKGEVSASSGRDNAYKYGLVPLIFPQSWNLLYWKFIGKLFDWKIIENIIELLFEYYIVLSFLLVIWIGLCWKMTERDEFIEMMMEENTSKKPDKSLYLVPLIQFLELLIEGIPMTLEILFESIDRQLLIDSLELFLKMKAVELRIPKGRKINYFKVTEKSATNHMSCPNLTVAREFERKGNKLKRENLPIIQEYEGDLMPMEFISVKFPISAYNLITDYQLHFLNGKVKACNTQRMCDSIKGRMPTLNKGPYTIPKHSKSSPPLVSPHSNIKVSTAVPKKTGIMPIVNESNQQSSSTVGTTIPKKRTIGVQTDLKISDFIDINMKAPKVICLLIITFISALSSTEAKDAFTGKCHLENSSFLPTQIQVPFLSNISSAIKFIPPVQTQNFSNKFNSENKFKMTRHLKRKLPPPKERRRGKDLRTFNILDSDSSLGEDEKKLVIDELANNSDSATEKVEGEEEDERATEKVEGEEEDETSTDEDEEEEEEEQNIEDDEEEEQQKTEDEEKQPNSTGDVEGILLEQEIVLETEEKEKELQYNKQRGCSTCKKKGMQFVGHTKRSKKCPFYNSKHSEKKDKGNHHKEAKDKNQRKGRKREISDSAKRMINHTLDQRIKDDKKELENTDKGNKEKKPPFPSFYSAPSLTDQVKFPPPEDKETRSMRVIMDAKQQLVANLQRKPDARGLHAKEAYLILSLKSLCTDMMPLVPKTGPINIHARAELWTKLSVAKDTLDKLMMEAQEWDDKYLQSSSSSSTSTSK